MKNSEATQRVYEELAERFGQLAEPRRRDHCLVLAADVALAAGRIEEAERLRQRLLHVNPHHLLRPYTSLTEALQSGDVRDYITDLRQQLPPDRVEQLLKGQQHVEEPAYKLVHEPGPPPPHDMTPLPGLAPGPRAAVAPPPPPPPQRKPAPKPPAATKQTSSPTAQVVDTRRLAGSGPTPAARWTATALFLLALLLGGAAFFIAFIRPLIE